MQIGFIGAGTMATAIIEGLIANKVVENDDIIVNSRTIEKLDNIRDKYGVNITLSKQEVLEFSDIIIFAVKPHQMLKVVEEIGEYIELKDGDKIFVSIAAGISIKSIERSLCKNMIESYGGEISFEYENDYNFKVVRTMPNTAAIIGESMTGVSLNANVKFSDIDKILKIFGSIGKVEIIEEKLMDAVVAISGSSPAYFYLMMDIMSQVAISKGMKREMAYKFVSQALLGSSKMVLDTKKDPSKLQQEVCCPGGTTIEAIKVFEEKGIRKMFVEAMKACMDKSKELSNEYEK